MRIITVGDTHLNYTNKDSTTSKNRLTTIKGFINQSNIDRCIILGDATDNATDTEFTDVKGIINSITKTTDVIIGNHDLISEGSTGKDRFESYFGSSKKRITVTEGLTTYQLLFIGMYSSGGHLYWDFDFSSITPDQKSMHTIIFIHGPVKTPPSDCTCCNWTDGYYFGYPMAYPSDIKLELNKFTNIRAIYTGHVHIRTSQIFDILDASGKGSTNVYHITLGALIDRDIGQCDTSRVPTDYVGYSKITPTTFQYTTLKYSDKFVDPFPDCGDPQYDFELLSA